MQGRREYLVQVLVFTGGTIEALQASMKPCADIDAGGVKIIAISIDAACPQP